jgi:hypothetical protein
MAIGTVSPQPLQGQGEFLPWILRIVNGADRELRD